MLYWRFSGGRLVYIEGGGQRDQYLPLAQRNSEVSVCLAQPAQQIRGGNGGRDCAPKSLGRQEYRNPAIGQVYATYKRQLGARAEGLLLSRSVSPQWANHERTYPEGRMQRVWKTHNRFPQVGAGGASTGSSCHNKGIDN